MDGIIENSTLILKDKNEKKNVYYKLVEFNIDGKENTYIIYTDYQETLEGINLYYGQYEENNIVPVTDKNDIEVILNYIEVLEEEIKKEFY